MTSIVSFKSNIASPDEALVFGKLIFCDCLPRVWAPARLGSQVFMWGYARVRRRAGCSSGSSVDFRRCQPWVWASGAREFVFGLGRRAQKVRHGAVHLRSSFRDCRSPWTGGAQRTRACSLSHLARAVGVNSQTHRCPARSRSRGHRSRV